MAETDFLSEIRNELIVWDRLCHLDGSHPVSRSDRTSLESADAAAAKVSHLCLDVGWALVSGLFSSTFSLMKKLTLHAKIQRDSMHLRPYRLDRRQPEHRRPNLYGPPIHPTH